jgi:predicted ATPase
LAFTRALEICERLTAPPELFFVLYGLLSVYHVRGLYLADRERSYQLLQLAKGAGDPTLLVVAHYAIGAATFHTGELLVAREHQEMSLSLYDRERDAPLALRMASDPRQRMLSHSGWTLWCLGYPDQALGRVNEAIATAQSLSHPFSLASAEFFSTMIHTLRREPRQAQESGERVIAIASEHGLGFWLLFTPIFRGWAIAQRGRHEEGIEHMRQALAVAHQAGLDIARLNLLCLLAEGYALAGRLDEALDTVNQGWEAPETQAEHYYESELHRLKGDLLLRKTDANAGEAQRCFIRAIEIARQQSAKSWELRATTSLAQLLVKQGRRNEACTMLAEIYNWFTEGFETGDLKDAKALLDNLNE